MKKRPVLVKERTERNLTPGRLGECKENTPVWVSLTGSVDQLPMTMMGENEVIMILERQTCAAYRSYLRVLCARGVGWILESEVMYLT